MTGFTYNGIHSSKFNCYYIPDAADRWFSSPDFEVYEKEVPGRDGGYTYGSRAKIRTISLKMYFEDITIEKRERIRAWLDRETMGELVFDDKPFVVYRSVRPKKTLAGKIYTTRYDNMSQDQYSGTFTIDFAVYEPYGYLSYKSYSGVDLDGAAQYCGILETNEMPSSPLTSSRNFLLYNPGTQTCHTVLTIGGTVGTGGQTITNATNGTKCKLSSLPASGYLKIDSFLGGVAVVNNGSETLDFQYHDQGFLTLAPYGQKIDNAIVTCTSNSTSAIIDESLLGYDLVGKYIRLGNSWKKIAAAQGTAITLNENAGVSGVKITKIVGMNEITITGTDISLSQLSMDYFPMI